MSDAPTDTPSEPTPTAEVAAPEAAAPEAVTEPEAPTEAPKAPDTAETEVQAAATEEVKPTATEEGKSAETVEESKPEESAAESTAEEPAASEEQIEEAPAPEPIEIPEGNGELVLVTGATGYLASHIIKQLVESGQFRVRGTVRSIEGNEKLDKLKSLLGQTSSKYELEFVEADLTQADTWTAAVKGCDYVIHTASPFPVIEPENASDVIDPARDGTISVLKACVEAGGVRRVVLTSSIVAITSGRTLDKNACNETMWADVDKSSSSYDKSKAIAEKAAWDFIKSELPEGSNLELSVVNPGFMLGPPLMNMDSTSLEVFKKLMNREYSVLPKISFACADVRDVALAHIRAMVIKQAAGHRHIVCGASVWLKDMANMMSQEFNSQGFNIPTSQAPYVLVWIKSHFDPAIKRILPSIGKIYHFDTKRMSEVLQVEPREVKDSLLEMGHAMINLEIVQKMEKQDKKSRKLTFRKKKEVEKDLENEEEKKDEPEKAASTSGSAENDSAPDAPIAIEDVEVIATDNKEPEIEEVKSEEPQAAAEDTAGSHSEEEVKDEATTSDPESSKKKEKKEKPKKEKKEKKKGGLFSFSFKKTKKPHVEKKSEDDKEDAATAEEAEAAADEAGAAATETAAEQTTAAVAEAQVTSEEAAPAVVIEAAAEETPAAAAEETPAAAEEVSTAIEETKPAVEETPAQEEAKVVAEPTETKAEESPSSEPAAAASADTRAE